MPSELKSKINGLSKFLDVKQRALDSASESLSHSQAELSLRQKSLRQMQSEINNAYAEQASGELPAIYAQTHSGYLVVLQDQIRNQSVRVQEQEDEVAKQIESWKKAYAEKCSIEKLMESRQEELAGVLSKKEESSNNEIGQQIFMRGSEGNE